MTYDSLSHPMLRQSSPKNMTCHFNSSQKTIAERYALTQYFKSTRLDLRTSNILISSTLTVDQFISKTIVLLRISHYCTEKMTSTYISHDFSTVHISKKDFSLRNQSGKNVDVQRGTDSTVYRKYPSLAKNQDGECSLVQQLTHPAHPKGSYRLRTCASVAKREKYEIPAE